LDRLWRTMLVGGLNFHFLKFASLWWNLEEEAFQSVVLPSDVQNGWGVSDNLNFRTFSCTFLALFSSQSNGTTQIH
jgi:hypothetical protein